MSARQPYPWWPILTALAVCAPLGAQALPSAAELEANRRRIEALHKDHPEQLAKLRAEAQAFFALSEPRQQQIVELDQKLRQESPATQQRLLDVLDRYQEWLEALDDATRKQIAAAPERKSRLALIQRLREEQWIAAQPKALQAELAKLAGPERRQRMAELKRQEQQRKLEWVLASRFWDELESKRPLPTKLADLPQSFRDPVQAYVRDYLLPRLTPEQKARLDKAEGQWPTFPMTLVELADLHPPALPGAAGPKTFFELPQDARAAITKSLAFAKKKDVAKALRLPEGRWPEFGTELAKTARKLGVVLPHEFLAYNRDCLQPAMQQFLKTKLEPALDAKETYRLTNAIDKWPDYPQTIQELSAAHGLTPPWYTLPRPEVWAKYRLARR